MFEIDFLWTSSLPGAQAVSLLRFLDHTKLNTHKQSPTPPLSLSVSLSLTHIHKTPLHE